MKKPGMEENRMRIAAALIVFIMSNGPLVPLAASDAIAGRPAAVGSVTAEGTVQSPAQDQVGDSLAAEMLAKLKDAFGGEQVLLAMTSMSYGLETQRTGSAPITRHYRLDFSAGSIAETDEAQGDVRYADPETGYTLVQGRKTPLSAEARASLLETLSANFLFYLTAPDLELIGPENIPDHEEVIWYRMAARGAVSPRVGIDPGNGQIVKVLGETGALVLERDYRKGDAGLIWPHRFLVQRNGETIFIGRFFDVSAALK